MFNYNIEPLTFMIRGYGLEIYLIGVLLVKCQLMSINECHLAALPFSVFKVDFKLSTLSALSGDIVSCLSLSLCLQRTENYNIWKNEEAVLRGTNCCHLCICQFFGVSTGTAICVSPLVARSDE